LIEDVLTLQVYREGAAGRQEAIRLLIPSDILAPNHLLLHPSISTQPAYYEVIAPEIFRVALEPGGSLTLGPQCANAAENELKRFDYVVCGDAGERSGLAAPYDEEETTHVMHTEALKNEDLFTFWLTHQNSDQISQRAPEPKLFQP